MTMQGFHLNDPGSRTRDGLSVVYAEAQRTEPFDTDSIFGGFTKMRALTYTSSIPMIVSLLGRFEFEDFECIFGHDRVLSQGAGHVLAFQKAIADMTIDGFVGVNASDENRVIYDMTAQGKARFRVVKDVVSHAKIYLLEGADRRRVIVGSANLSETAFSGRQAETLTAFDDDDVAWEHYAEQYSAVRDIASLELDLKQPRAKAQLQKPSDIPLEGIPTINEAKRNHKGATIYVSVPTDGEAQFGAAAIQERIERIEPVIRNSAAGLAAPKDGVVSIKPKQAHQIARIAFERSTKGYSHPYLTREGDGFHMEGKPFPLNADADAARNDAGNWLKFFAGYEQGFRGDVAEMQRRYFTFMSWLYYAPLMCDLRNAGISRNAFIHKYPVFGMIYGSSSCGKSSLIKTLMTSMFGRHHEVPTSYFTVGQLTGLQRAYKRYPVIFDDVQKSRFDNHGPEMIKNDHIPMDEYPCFAISLNADVRSFKLEVIKRCMMIYTRASLPNNEVDVMEGLHESISQIQGDMTTALYRQYLKRADARTQAAIENDDNADPLELSSSVLVELFKENLPVGASLPGWCASVTTSEYQSSAYERPKRQLMQMLHTDNYSGKHPPPEGRWALSAGRIWIQAPFMQANRIKSEIPDWLLDDASSVGPQIALVKDAVDTFLAPHSVKPKRGWRNLIGA